MNEPKPQWDAFAVVSPGLEAVALREMQNLGIPATATPGGLDLRLTDEQLWAVHHFAALPTRVLVRASTAPIDTPTSVGAAVARTSWAPWLTSGRAIAVRGTSPQVEQRVLTALLRVSGAKAAPGKERGNHVEVYARLTGGVLTLSVDATGQPLYKRGYRTDVGEAPLRETHASALLEWAGWKPGTPLLDPFCGTGTIPIEAARQAAGIPPGADRHFAFESWPSHDAGAYQRWRVHQHVLASAPDARRIAGVDIDQARIAVARSHALRAGVDAWIRWDEVSALDVAPHAAAGAVVSNPPFGDRLSTRKDVRALLRQWGDHLRRYYRGWTIAVLSPNARAGADLGLVVRNTASMRLGGKYLNVLTGRIF